MKNRRLLCMILVVCFLITGICSCGKLGDVSGDTPVSEESSKDNKENTDSDKDSEEGVLEGDEHPYIGTAKATVKATDEAPQIDGVKDALYDSVGTKISLDEFNLNYWEQKPQNDSAVAYVTYDKNYLYLYVEIVDDNIDYTGDEVWKKDSVGVLVDFNYIRDKREYEDYQGTGIGYVNVACDNTYEYYHEYLKNSYKSSILSKSLIRNAEGNYAIEMRLPFIEGFNGKSIGFEVMNTDCINGDRCGVRTWNIDGSQMYLYTHCAGTLEFETNLWK